LRDVDCRKQSADWKKIGEDKLKAEREKKMGGGVVKKAAKPKTVGTSSAKNIIDTGACELP
jgi:translation initiation factor 3 subunit J